MSIYPLNFNVHFQVFNKADKNKDNRLTRTELANHRAALFKKSAQEGISAKQQEKLSQQINAGTAIDKVLEQHEKVPEGLRNEEQVLKQRQKGLSWQQVQEHLSQQNKAALNIKQQPKKTPDATQKAPGGSTPKSLYLQNTQKPE